MESCETCKSFWVDQGDVELQRGTRGEVIPRGKGYAPEWTEELCGVCRKRDLALEDWTDISRATWDHYVVMREIGATDRERADPRVRRNIVLLADHTRRIDRLLQARQMNEMLAEMFGAK